MNNDLIKKENKFYNKIKDWIKKVIDSNSFKSLVPINLGGTRKNV